MSVLNTEKIGTPICKIIGGRFANKIIFVANKKEAEDIIKPFKKLSLPEDNGVFQQIFDPDAERNVGYISGPPGSGKSTYICKSVKEWRKLKKNKDKPIYLFSAKKTDKSLDDIEPKRIIIDKSLVDDPLDFNDFENTLCIFDDIDALKGSVKKAVYQLLDDMINVGRDKFIDVITTNHTPTGGKDTAASINGADYIVYFPYAGSKKINYLLENYVGLNPKSIKTIKNTNSRWATIIKTFPQIVYTENFISLISELE